MFKDKHSDSSLLYAKELMILSHLKDSSPRIITRKAISFTYHCHLVMCAHYLLSAHQHAQYLPPEMYVLYYHTASHCCLDCYLSPHLQPPSCHPTDAASKPMLAALPRCPGHATALYLLALLLWICLPHTPLPPRGSWGVHKAASYHWEAREALSVQQHC